MLDGLNFTPYWDSGDVSLLLQGESRRVVSSPNTSPLPRRWKLLESGKAEIPFLEFY